MFWMRNKENNFPICTLIWRPVDCDVPNCTFNVPISGNICLDFDFSVPVMKFIYCWDYNGRTHVEISKTKLVGA